MNSRKKKLIYFFLINISLFLAAIVFVLAARIEKGEFATLVTECPSRAFLGIYCPSCGASRALSALIRGKIVNSLIYNPALLPSLIAFIVYDVKAFVDIIKNKDRIVYIHKPVWISLSAILLINWIVRNSLLIIWNIDYISGIPF